MLPASLAACVPVFIATPTSAWASAGASLVPSPVMATSLPSACSSRMRASLFSGVACGEEVVDAGFGRDGGGGQRVVAGDHDGADAHGAQLGEALAHAALDDVLQMDDAEHLLVRRPPPAACRPIARCVRRSSSAPAGPSAAVRRCDELRRSRRRALANLRAVRGPRRSCGSAR